MFAVIKTGGKQYVVTPDQKIKIEKITGDQGANVSFDRVLLVADGDKVSVGTPDVSARVEGSIIRQARDKKKIVFKYHSKARVRKTKGHRQPFTEVQITSIK
ncbi:MAG: 50S ribosomal protein L21 [Candidatus Pacebacteria bacterium]|nr:50S ribosomal protein L21 [Candidatus Paceibacterota bacterium]